MLCSLDCPCNGNPMIFQDDPDVKIFDVSKMNGEMSEALYCPKDVRCLYFDYTSDNYNA